MTNKLEKIIKKIELITKSQVIVSNTDDYNYIYYSENNLHKFIHISHVTTKPNSAINYKIDSITKDYPDKIISGQVKVRFIYLNDRKVITTSINDDDNSHIVDAKIRRSHPDLPSPHVIDISNGVVTEELVNDPTPNNSILAHPKRNLLALNAMKNSYLKYFENDQSPKTIIHGQIYKSDHILICNQKLYLVDWSEGGNKSQGSRGDLFFDIASSIKWVIFKRKFNYYYFFRYILSYVKLAKEISTELKLLSWKNHFNNTLNNICDKQGKYSQKAFLYKILKYIIKKI
ncbi:hypothetical protein [Halobacteriovorax sp.]|uniref:hypothetical protein n=1 Tax=Halobacteriovorax sp. TaxID=2020862 RepID=UPI003AF2187C